MAMVMAKIYLLAGQYDNAIDELEFVLSIPAPVSAKSLRINPFFEPLRDQPRFQALLEKYGEPDGS